MKNDTLERDARVSSPSKSVLSSLLIHPSSSELFWRDVFT